MRSDFPLGPGTCIYYIYIYMALGAGGGQRAVTGRPRVALGTAAHAMPPPLRCCAAAAAALLLLLLLLLLPPPAATTLASSACCVGRPRSVSASCWGWTAADSTESLQAAIDCGASEVRVPKMRGPWVVSTTATRRSPAAVGSRGTHAAALYLRSNQRVVLEEGVVVLAKRGSFHGLQDSLIMGTGISNASIVGLGANGATLRMWKLDYANASLYQQGTCSARGACRMGIELTNVSDVLLSGLTIQSTGGDGIFARGVTNGTFSGLVLDNNFRQGVSVSSGVNLLFEDCRFINTGLGAAASPACGVDMEPDHGSDSLSNITFRRCVAANNTGCGFSISPHNLLSPPFNGTSRGLSVRFEDVRVCHLDSVTGLPSRVRARARVCGPYLAPTNGLLCAVLLLCTQCAVDNRGQLTQAQCKLQPGGCGWTLRSGWVLSGFPPTITGSVDIVRSTSVGGEQPAVCFEAYGGGGGGTGSCRTTLTDVSLSNAGVGAESLSGGAPSPVVLFTPTSTGKYEKLNGPFPYGGVVFENITVALQAEAPAYRAQKHHRAWLEVDAPHGLRDLSLNATVEALRGSGGCALVKEEIRGAGRPWAGVTFGHACRGGAP